MVKKQAYLALVVLLCFVFDTYAQSGKTYVVKANEIKGTVQPTMWGIFFEDINMGADGGVYAELVKNRSFEFHAPMMGWNELKKDGIEGSILVINTGKKNSSNPRYIRIKLGSEKGYGLSNEGFRGIGVKEKSKYNFSVLARVSENSNLNIHVELVDTNGTKIGGASFQPNATEWKKYELGFDANATNAKAKLNLWFEGKGEVDLDMISLFPNDTWKGRKGGMRADLVQLLADLKPGFLRFPGGCIVEGRELATRYQWKKTIGDPEQREMIVNRWNTEFRHRPTPDYFQSFGLGFLEYFQLAEDIGAEPLPILNCGMACQFNSGEVAPLEELDVYIQDALDLIEFANGDVNTKWGKMRADLGHPEPFNMKFLGVGNEQWGEQYIERYAQFAKALKDKYPSIQLISSAGPFSDGKLFTYLDDTLRKMKVDIIDEHYYRKYDWFLNNAKRYDKYDRNGPKIFAGEYAVQTVGGGNPDNKNNWLGALSEAAFMTGLERNADIVTMASYAPLFAHAEGWQWAPDLIWFDNLHSYGTPNYHVQKLFSTNRGTHVVPVSLNNSPIAGEDSIYASAVLDKDANELVLKIVNASGADQLREIKIEGAKKSRGTGKHILLESQSLTAENSFEEPHNIVPVEKKLEWKGKKISLSLKPHSFSVIRIKV
jgi:alpha-L-arabinofuranosidase